MGEKAEVLRVLKLHEHQSSTHAKLKMGDVLGITDMSANKTKKLQGEKLQSLLIHGFMDSGSCSENQISLVIFIFKTNIW